MDGATQRRLLWSFLSSWVARLSSTIMQLVGVPVFLHFWSVPLYGNWIVLSAIPSYLSFSSVGFGSVAGNEMTMRVARADQTGALRVFQSCWWLIVGLCAGILLLLSGAPIPEPIVGYGPFVMNSRQEIETAVKDFQRGKFGRMPAPQQETSAAV